MELRTGKVKFYIDQKLYGFLIDEETGEEVYIPVSGLIDEIRKNDRVSYVVSENNGKKEAIDVKQLRS